MLNGLDLFSGIGGIALALSDWVRPVAYCESDKYAQSVLLSNMRRNNIAYGPIWDDVRTLRGEHIDVPINIITGGFPCQDISVAGHGVGLEGERSGLFFEIIRLSRDLRPQFIFLENVPAITVRGLDRVLLELSALGYDSRWTIVSAAEVGACHQRDRWFLLAHDNRPRELQSEGIKQDERERTCHSSKNASDANGIALRIQPIRITEREKTGITQFDGETRSIADTDGPRLEGTVRRESRIPRPAAYNGWNSQPTIRRGADGLFGRVDRIRGLGNAVVPAQAREAFEILAGLK